MILLDTHIWIWWVSGSEALTAEHTEILTQYQPIGLAISIISCWEVAKLVEYKRLQLALPVETWIFHASHNKGVRVVDLTTRILVESTQLPSPFHKDPADQIIVATSRVLDIPLVTADTKILSYTHVNLLP